MGNKNNHNLATNKNASARSIKHHPMAGAAAVTAAMGALLMLASVPPASAADYWIKVKGSDCQIWSDEAVDRTDVVTWSGACKDGKSTGKGKLTWTKGGKPAGSYEGFMDGGKLNGLGKVQLVAKGGTIEIEGAFKDGDLDGGGLIKDADGNIYEGELKDGKPHGTGYQKIGDEEYVGAFVDGERHGLGLVLGKTTAYLGELDKGVASGSGVLEDDLGGRFHGQFSNNMPHGFGTYVAKDGAVYQGQFVKGQASGAMLVRSSGTAKAVVETWKDGKKVK